MRMVFASTVPETLNNFMRGQLGWLVSQGHEIHVVSSPGRSLVELVRREGAEAHPIPMQRDISLVADARSLWAWVRTVREVRPDVVVVSTPKAGLLGGLAAAFLRVPRRVYLMRGARFEGESGARGVILRGTERLSCALAHRVVAVSPSLARVALDARVVSPRKLATVGAGSSNGVDLQRFHPPSSGERAAARRLWGIEEGAVAVVFLGRLHPDKGLAMLRDATTLLGDSDGPPVVLLLAGSQEGADTVLASNARMLVRRLGHVDDVPGLLHAADLLVLPTQREGFPNVALEAAASGLSVVTTDATGAMDSVVHGVTGFVVPRTDGRAFGLAVSHLVGDRPLRESFGAAARVRVENHFRNEVVWQGMYREYLGGLPYHGDLVQPRRDAHGGCC